MIEFGGVIYYIDINALDKIILLETSDKITTVHEKKMYNHKNEQIGSKIYTTTNERDKEINTPRYDVIRMMLEILVDNDEEFDDTLGVDRALENTSLGYKLAFNTLFEYGILKEKEE